MVEKEEILSEIESEIKRAKGQTDDFEIEVVDDPVQEAKEEAKDKAAENAQQKDDEFGPKVEKRIKKLVCQRREAEIQAR